MEYSTGCASNADEHNPQVNRTMPELPTAAPRTSPHPPKKEEPRGHFPGRGAGHTRPARAATAPPAPHTKQDLSPPPPPRVHSSPIPTTRQARELGVLGREDVGGQQRYPSAGAIAPAPAGAPCEAGRHRRRGWVAVLDEDRGRPYWPADGTVCNRSIPRSERGNGPPVPALQGLARRATSC